LEEATVTDERYFDGLRHAGPEVALAERRQKIRVTDDGEGRSERPDEVLLPVGVQPILHAEPSIVLGQHCRRDANEAQTAMKGGGCEANRVEEGAAADGQHRRVTIEPSVQPRSMKLRHEREVGLGLLAAREDPRRGCKLET